MTKLKDVKKDNPIILLGCGKMGTAMLRGWLSRGLNPDSIHIIDPFLDPIEDSFEKFDKKNLHVSTKSLPKKISPAFLIVAVKPQMMDEALKPFTELNLSNSVILSIAAGKTINYFEDIFGKEKSIIRAMPNTPASISKGITVCCSNPNATKEQKTLCTILLEAIGLVEWVDSETLIDAVTALSGSGPAYIFHMTEAMEAAGEAIGLPKELSQKLARQTVIGAGALLEKSKQTPTKLREEVTSPNGTTAAALDVLMSNQGLATLMRRAMQEAKNRSKELAN